MAQNPGDIFFTVHGSLRHEFLVAYLFVLKHVMSKIQGLIYLRCDLISFGRLQGNAALIFSQHNVVVPSYNKKTEFVNELHTSFECDGEIGKLLMCQA